jgi:regulator of protease activity HflC (stomatin/prohibitin superfamily)
MRIRQLVRFAVIIAFVPACNLFGLGSSQPILPTTVQELTLSESAPDSGADPQFEAVEGNSKDGQAVKFDITVLFRIDPTAADHILEKWGDSYGTRFLVPALRQATEDAISQYTAYEIYGEGRLDLAQKLQISVIEKFLTEGFIVQDVLIRNIRFTPEFTAKIEQEIVATMAAEAQQPAALATP